MVVSIPGLPGQRVRHHVVVVLCLDTGIVPALQQCMVEKIARTSVRQLRALVVRTWTAQVRDLDVG